MSEQEHTHEVVVPYQAADAIPPIVAELAKTFTHVHVEAPMGLETTYRIVARGRCEEYAR